MKVKRSSGCNISYLFISIMIQTIIFSEVCGQSISVSGKITSNRYPIQNASVTFIDNSDTTNKISTLTDNAGIYQIVLVSSVELNSNSIPDKFELVQNYPNPFSTSTAIPYRINQQSEITITIYDILGRKVRSYPVGVQRAGNHNLIWDGRDDFGARVASGIYFYMIQSKGESRVKKMIFTGNGNNAVMIPNLQASTPYSCLNKANKTEGNVFTIRVGNTGATTPLVVPEEFERVAIQNGTTIDLSVAYIPLTFDFDSLHQVISGYGAASPWYLPVATDSEIENAFGTDDGQIGLSIYRITVEADSNLWSKWVPSTKNAQDMGAIIIASPWYAPGSLTEFRDGKTRIQLDKYTEYAAHLSRMNLMRAIGRTGALLKCSLLLKTMPV